MAKDKKAKPDKKAGKKGESPARRNKPRWPLDEAPGAILLPAGGDLAGTDTTEWRRNLGEQVTRRSPKARRPRTMNTVVRHPRRAANPGLDHYEVTKYRGWYHHITLCLLALAFLKAVQHEWGEKWGPRIRAGDPSAA